MATGSEAAAAPQASYESVDALMRERRRGLRAKCVVVVALTVVAVVLSLQFPTWVATTFNVDDSLVGSIIDLPLAVQLMFESLHDFVPFVPALEIVDDPAAHVLASSSSFYDFGSIFIVPDALTWRYNAARVFVTFAAGALLGLAGMLYQNVFRNPIATPTMLGVQSGVNIGVLVMVVVFGTQAAGMVFERYAICYGCGLALLALTLAGGAFISGKRPFQVVDLLLVGTAVGGIVGLFTQYIPAGWDETTYSFYRALSEMLSTDTSPWAFASLAAVALVAVVPVFLMRWKLNALSLSDEEVRLLGVDPARLRVFALVAGSLMVLVALTVVGSVGLVAVVVPFSARYIFGSEAREQFWGNLLLGPLALLACRSACDLVEFFFPILGTSLSLGTVASLLMLPAFLWIVAGHARGWE